jgi:hypothetical protein
MIFQVIYLSTVYAGRIDHCSELRTSYREGFMRLNTDGMASGPSGVFATECTVTSRWL